MEAEKEESEDEEMEDDGADVSRRASTRVVWILMVVNSLSENPPQFTGFLFLNIQPPTSTKEPLRWQTLGKRYGKHWMFWSWFVHFQLGRWLQVYCHHSVGKARNNRISRPFVRICDPNLMGALFWDFVGNFPVGKTCNKNTCSPRWAQTMEMMRCDVGGVWWEVSQDSLSWLYVWFGDASATTTGWPADMIATCMIWQVLWEQLNFCY